jgi:chaperonin GroES
MKVRPLHDWTIIKLHGPKEISTGGIIIPDFARDIPTEGTVVAIGPGRYKKEPGKKERYTPTILKPGQKVYFMEYATLEVELDGKEIIFIREEDILGTLEDDKQLVVKKSHPVEAKREHPLMPHATATPPPLVPPAEKKPAAKKKKVKKEKAVSKTRKPSTKAKKTTKKKTTKPAKKVTLKKTAKKAVKKKTASVTTKKSRTAKKSVKRVAQKSVTGKKAAPKKKSVKGSRKKKK